MNHYNVLKVEDVDFKKMIVIEKDTKRVCYISSMSNPYKHARINNEFLEFRIEDYFSNEYCDYMRPSELLDNYSVPEEVLIEIIKLMSKTIETYHDKLYKLQ